MIAERHYDDEALISFLESGELDAARDPHLVACQSCNETLESFRVIAATLGEEAVWDLRELREEPVPATIASLRAFADTMALEDAQAELHLEELLAGPRETWMPRLLAHPEYRTAGVVRKLIAATDRAIDTMPPDAVALTELATEIADHLPPAAYPSDTVAKLRGAAWRETAYALFYVGSFREAEQAFFVAESHFCDCLIDEYDRARLAIVKAVIYRALEMPAEAVAAAGDAVIVFSAFGDATREARAAFAQAYVFLQQKDYKSALAIFERLLHTADSEDSVARLHGNIGFCNRELGRFDAALRHYRIALEIFETAGARASAARAHWNVAGVLLAAGAPYSAVENGLLAARGELAAVGLRSEAAIAALELVELYLANGRLDAVENMCREVLTFFQQAGLPYGEQAQAAVAYMLAAAQEQKASIQLARHVTEFVRTLPKQPALLFAQPPL